MTDAETPLAGYPDADRVERLTAAGPRVEAVLRERIRADGVPGAAWGLVVDGALVASGGLGVRDAATAAGVDADTVFRIASMTKSFVAAAVMRLRDAGRLRLDDRLIDLVPETAELRYPSADSTPLDVHDLLTMSAGFPQDDPWADRQLWRDDADIGALYRQGLSFSTPPGTAYEYSNVGYMLLGRVVTRASGMPALDYIDREILRPLGMDATVWSADAVPAERLAQGHRRQDGGWLPEPFLPSGGDVAAFAGLFSSVRDLARWVGLFQQAWPPRDDADDARPLSRGTLREMQRIWRAFAPEVRYERLAGAPTVVTGGYGYGLTIRHDGRVESVGHSGGLPGFGSHMRWVPGHGFGIVALGNVTYAAMQAASLEAIDAVLASARARPRARPPAAATVAARDAVVRLIDRWDDALADRTFADNFFADTARARWRERLTRLGQRHGALRPSGEPRWENWLRGSWSMTGDRGHCRVWMTLSPTMPPRVQMLRIDSVLPPPPALRDVLERLVELTARPSRRALAALLDTEVDAAALWRELRIAVAMCGRCRLGALLAGDGIRSAEFALDGPFGSVAVAARLGGGGRLDQLRFRPLERDDSD
ncbi:MAG: beta-lactamase family protein [Ectothiorhodospiraceae bacterium]|nr:beta-lactamase family protein [Ectothiorhodospiraceae bacterium]